MTKRPRHYAYKIIQLPTREERRAALADVPAEHRQTVEFYVRDFYARKNKTKLPDYNKVKLCRPEP